MTDDIASGSKHLVHSVTPGVLYAHLQLQYSTQEQSYLSLYAVLANMYTMTHIYK